MSEDIKEEITLEGGAQDHEGFQIVGSISTEDDKPGDFVFDDLLPQVRIHHLNGVSVSLNQAVQNGPHGTINVRVIHDLKLRVYLFRKDEDGVTTFRVSTGLNVQ